MPVRVCEVCGKSFMQGRGRPARRCPAHRDGGGKYGTEHRKLRAATIGQAWGQACTRCGQTIAWGRKSISTTSTALVLVCTGAGLTPTAMNRRVRGRGTGCGLC